MENRLKYLIKLFCGTSPVSKLLKWNYLCIKKLNPNVTYPCTLKVDASITEQLGAMSVAEPLYTRSRRVLFQIPLWRYGPNRVREVSKDAFNGFQPFGSIIGKTYMDLGCGVEHPYGTSTIMFLNGASRTLAFDIRETDQRRAAEALYDLIADCAANPNAWHFSRISRRDFMNNIYKFNIPALEAGDLKMGIANVPLEHVVGDIYANSIGSNSIDFMLSISVLEHLLDFPKALFEIRRTMAPGGIACHYIDLKDHRYYLNPGKYHQWSFLAENDGWSGVCNRLRYSEIRKCIEEANFEILRFEGKKASMPEDFRKHLKGRFRNMSDEDLNITGVFCVLGKPKLEK